MFLSIGTAYPRRLNRLHGTQSGALKASKLHPDLLSLYENVEDAEFLPGSSDYTINKKGQLVYCDHE
jgi:hypothetical protein